MVRLPYITSCSQSYFWLSGKGERTVNNHSGLGGLAAGNSRAAYKASLPEVTRADAASSVCRPRKLRSLRTRLACTVVTSSLSNEPLDILAKTGG